MLRTVQFSAILMRIIEVENDYFKLFSIAFFLNPLLWIFTESCRYSLSLVYCLIYIFLQILRCGGCNWSRVSPLPWYCCCYYSLTFWKKSLPHVHYADVSGIRNSKYFTVPNDLFKTIWLDLRYSQPGCMCVIEIL